MENLLDYFEFSAFFKDESDFFFGNQISFRELNETHFLIFEKENLKYNLYVSRFKTKKEIGKKKPDILELVVTDYDKSISEHRIALRKYLE